MSRLMVIVLLAANLLLAGFHVAGQAAASRPEPQAAGPGDTHRELPSITLLTEVPVPVAASPALHCYTLGPFETEAALLRARLALESLTLGLRQRRTEALMELGFWVALPAVDSFSAAAGAMRTLQQAGLDDLAVVNNEPGVYHVSLGYFLDERNARRRRDQVRELGFDAVTRLQRETQPRWWLDYVQSVDGTPVEQLLGDLASPGLNRGIPCSGALAGP